MVESLNNRLAQYEDNNQQRYNVKNCTPNGSEPSSGSASTIKRKSVDDNQLYVMESATPKRVVIDDELPDAFGTPMRPQEDDDVFVLPSSCLKETHACVSYSPDHVLAYLTSELHPPGRLRPEILPIAKIGGI